MAGTGGVATGGRSWWQWSDRTEDGQPQRPSKALQYTGIDETVRMLKEAVKEHRPEGILGFSQGATAVALLLAALQEEADKAGHSVAGMYICM